MNIKVGDFIRVKNASLKNDRCGIVTELRFKPNDTGVYYISKYHLNDFIFFTQFKFITDVYTLEENPEMFI